MKRSIASSLLLAVAVAITPRVYATVYECNTQPCRVLWVLVKEYDFHYGYLVSCTSWDAYVGYGYCLNAADFSYGDGYNKVYELAGYGWGLACSASLTTPTRVPVFGTNPLGTNEKTVSITLSPSPLPAGKTATVSISTVSGVGGMTFSDGTTSKTVNQSVNLGVRGTANSTVASNLKINVMYSDAIMSSSLGSGLTTVRTHPYRTQQATIPGNLSFGFWVDIDFLSESGNQSHISGIFVREYVSHAGVWPNPPFTQNPTSPFIKSGDSSGPYTADHGLADEHRYSSGLVNFSAPGTGWRTQFLQFKDDVIPIDWTTLTQNAIDRIVFYNLGWKFKTRVMAGGIDTYVGEVVEP